MNKRFVSLWVLLCLLLAFPTAGVTSVFDRFFTPEDVQTSTEKRFTAWQTLILDAKNDNEWQILNRVNRFFNQISYSPDAEQWGQNDYWATPSEFLRSNAGDCEDYAIAKFYTLIAIGVDVKKLRLTHVTIIPSNQAHMVLLVEEDDSDTLLTLDNRTNEIAPFVIREDLMPLYSFNDVNLWITHTKQHMTKVGNASQIKRWVTLNQRIQLEDAAAFSF